MALVYFKLFQDLNKKEFKFCILIRNGHKFFFFETENYCQCPTTGYAMSEFRVPCPTTGYGV